jgi:hypothetical protein
VPDANRKERKRIIDRASRMVRQSRTLRKVADELLKESQDLRESANELPKRSGPRKRRG